MLFWGKIRKKFSITGQVQRAHQQETRKTVEKHSKKQYIKHAKHVLEKTKMEAFQEFKVLDP